MKPPRLHFIVLGSLGPHPICAAVYQAQHSVLPTNADWLHRVGMDLSKVTFPTFVLEPRSMLERITDFMSHPDLVFGCVSFTRMRICTDPTVPFLGPRAHDRDTYTSCFTSHTTYLRVFSPTLGNTHSAEQEEDPEERFIRVLQYYLAGWHIKPKGVKKPCVHPSSPSVRGGNDRRPSQIQPCPGRVLPLSVRLPRRLAGLLHRRTRCVAPRAPTTPPRSFPRLLPIVLTTAPPCSARIVPIAGAVSHHPPVSAFYYVTPANKVCIVGELRPKSKFLGNSVSTQMDGENRVYLMGRPSDGRTSRSLLSYPLYSHPPLRILRDVQPTSSRCRTCTRGASCGAR